MSVTVTTTWHNPNLTPPSAYDSAKAEYEREGADFEALSLDERCRYIQQFVMR